MITLVSLLFITMIHINCKITNFSLQLFVCFFEITIIISWCTPNKLLVENPLASTLRIHSFFSPLHNLKNNIKRISTIKPAIKENMECTII